MDFKQKLLIFVGGSLTVLIYRYFKYRKTLQQLIEYHNKDISFVNEVIFFSGPRTSECDTHVSRKIICSSRNCPFRKLKDDFSTIRADFALQTLVISMLLKFGIGMIPPVKSFYTDKGYSQTEGLLKYLFYYLPSLVSPTSK